MAKLTDKTTLSNPASGDYIHVVDVDDTTSDAAGTSKKATIASIVALVESESSGDMLKATYDTGNNGVVDNAEQLEGQNSAYHLDRTNHTGSQAISTVAGLQTALDGKEPIKGSDDNYVTDSEKVVIGNTSGTNTGDQDLSSFETTSELNSRDTNNRARANHTGTQAANTITGLSSVATSNDYADLDNKPTIPTVDDTAYDATSWNGNTDAPTKNAIRDKIETLGGSPEGTAVLSTGETGGSKFLREDGDGTSSWQAIPGGGDALTASPLSQFAATTSAQLAGVISDETGSGSAVFATSPTLVTPALGTPSSLVLTNATGLPEAQVTTHQAALTITESQISDLGTYSTATGVENNADVTDTANVTAAGALMDSELADIAAIKATSDAVASDLNTGTDAAKFVTPDALAGSNFGRRAIMVEFNAGATALTTGDGKWYSAPMPAEMNGMNLVDAKFSVATAGVTGTTDFQIHNVTDAIDVLSTKATIDSSETTTDSAATPLVINTSNDDVATGDIWRIDCDAISSGTAPNGGSAVLIFQLP